MAKRTRLVLVALAVTIGSAGVGCDRLATPACSSVLPGSRQLADAHALRVDTICGDKSPLAPSWADGWWDGTAIHVWTDTRVLDVEGHEVGHVWADRHPDEFTYWTAWRGLQGNPNAGEDFAEGFDFCNYGWTYRASFTFWAGWPTTAQCEAMRSWHG